MRRRMVFMTVLAVLAALAFPQGRSPTSRATTTTPARSSSTA